MLGGHSSWLLPTQDDGPGVKKSLTGKLAPQQSCKARVMGVWGGPQGVGLTYRYPPKMPCAGGLGFPLLCVRAVAQGSAVVMGLGHVSFKPVGERRILVPSLTGGTRRSEPPPGLFAATSTSRVTFVCSTLSQTLWGIQKSALPQQRWNHKIRANNTRPCEELHGEEH